jgi:hypothetical protein
MDVRAAVWVLSRAFLVGDIAAGASTGTWPCDYTHCLIASTALISDESF